MWNVIDTLFISIINFFGASKFLPITLELGMWAGLSVYPITKSSPERVMNIVKKYGTDQIMVHSAADWGISDPLSVPLVAREMRKEGFSNSEI